MKRYLLLIAVVFGQLSMAQSVENYAAIDSKMAQIPESSTSSTTAIANYISANFTSESDRIRAAFYWTASSLSYDVPNMTEPNFVYTPEEKIASALKNRKGVCIHYAEVFKDIANKLGIQTQIIIGYTKQNGKVAPISHAWCGSKIDGKWMLFDPTWGSGYVNPTQKFVKKFNNQYFKTPPSKLITSHMPFDYMWQFLSDPITNNEFVSGKPSKEKRLRNYDFSTEIEKYEQLPQAEKAFEASQRIEQNGVINDLIVGYLANKKNEFTVLRQNRNITDLNEIVASFNEAIASLNDFIHYRNAQFKPTVSDDDIKGMIQTPLNQLKKCRENINKIGSVGKENASSVNALKKSIAESIKMAEDHDAFVTEYLTKSKGQRKSMFVKKISWLGSPSR